MKEDNGELSIANQHLDQAYFYEENGKPTQALQECDLVIATNPALLAEAYNLRGIILEELGRSEEAIGAYKKALALEPTFQEAADNLHELESDIARQYNLVTIASFCDPVEAQRMKQHLTKEGIWSLMTEERETGVVAIFAGNWRGMKLQVREQDTYKALPLFGVEPKLHKVRKVKQDEEPRCPECDSLNIRYERYSKWGVYGTWQRTRPEGRFAEKKWECRDCGYVWSMRED